jgi:ankyrin repeat protein
VAISHNQMDIVQLLCQMGINVNIKSPSGKTPLINSMLMRNKNIMLCLLNYNANVNDQDNYGITTLHYAYNGQLEMIELLLNYDANISLESNMYKFTALDFANKIIILFIAFIQKRKSYEIFGNYEFFIFINILFIRFDIINKSSKKEMQSNVQKLISKYNN